MSLIELILVILIPIGVACAAVPLALSCRINPRTQEVIVPYGPLVPRERPRGDDPDEPTSDLSSRPVLIMTISVALGVVLVMSLVLGAMTHADHMSFLLRPLASFFRGLNSNVLVIVLMTFILASQAPVVARSFRWMTPRWGIVVALLVAGVLAAWALIDSWMTFDLMSALICVMIALTLQIRISFLRLSLILCIAAFLYDALQVFGTGNMGKYAAAVEPVLSTPGRQVNLPVMFILPHQLALVPRDYGLIGVGDVVVLCVLAITTARFSRRIGSWAPVGVLFAGFTVGILLCVGIAAYFNAIQPATIYIVPLCALSVMLYAKLRGSFAQLSMPPYAVVPKEK